MATMTMFLNRTSHEFLPLLSVRNQPKSTISHKLLLYQALITLSNTIKVAAIAYTLVILLMTLPSIQRRFLYGHRGFGFFSTPFRSDSILNNPETQGFLRNQVTTHRIQTPDGEQLYAWLVMPVGAYLKHEATLTRSWSMSEAAEIALQILRSDPKAVLGLYLHGSGNNLATPWRCEAYQNLSSGAPNHLYILAFDYRGFGRSSGRPSEEGLITDAVAVLSWVEKRLMVPRSKTLVLGHSLGAAAAVAALQRVVEKNQYAEYAGLILCSGFTDIPNLAVYLKLGGLIPFIVPLTWFKTSRRWIENKLFKDCWRTERRLRDLVATSDVIRLTIIHAINDDRIPKTMSDVLYGSCIDELERRGAAVNNMSDDERPKYIQEVRASGKSIRKVVLNSGGHDAYMGWHCVCFEATRILTMIGAIE